MRQVAAGMDTVGYSDVAVSGSNFEALATGVFERFFFFFFSSRRRVAANYVM